MSLRVWLPLNGNLNNQGLSDITVTNSGATVDNNGKIGKCYSFGTGASGLEIPSSTMNTFTTECSLSMWLYIVSWNNNYATFFQAGKGSYSWNDYIFGVLRNSNSSKLCFTITEGTTSSQSSFQTPDLSLNTWYHLTFVYKSGHCIIYMNGELYQDYSTSSVPSFSSISKITMGRSNALTYQTNCKLNDVRIYDHALSPKEIEILSRGLVCHYPLEGANNTLLPFGYQQLEYIESSGASAFDTKYKFNPEIDSLKMIFKGNDVANNGMLFGQSAGAYFWLYYYGSYGIRVYASNGSSQEGISGISSDLVKHTAEFKNKHYIIDGVDKGGLLNTYTEANYSSWMFSYGFKNYCFKGRIYYAQIGRNGKVQRTFIPAKRLSDSKIGMYELNTNEFFPSGTSTAFTAGDVVGTPSTIYDCSGYKNNGTINGSLTTSNDTARYSASTYIPKTGYIQHPNALGSDTMNQEWTCCAWVKLDNTSANQQMNTFNLGNQIVHSSNSVPLLYVNSGSHDYYRYGSVALSANVWTHIAFVFKNSDGTRNIYVNGVLTNSLNAPNKDSTPAGIPSTVTIFDGNFNGYVSDYREYATALSAAQVAELYNTAVSVANNGTLMGYELVEV